MSLLVHKHLAQTRERRAVCLGAAAPKRCTRHFLSSVCTAKRHKGRGYYGAIIGDGRRSGSYSSYQADLIVRMPKKELQAVLIKQQHNVISNGKDYPLRLPRIMHEYIVLWQRPRAVTVARPNVSPAL